MKHPFRHRPASTHLASPKAPREVFNETMTAEILLVDDNAIQATTRRAILVRSGRSVVLANGAVQALQMLDDEELLRSLDLIITDRQNQVLCIPRSNQFSFITAE